MAALASFGELETRIKKMYRPENVTKPCWIKLPLFKSDDWDYIIIITRCFRDAQVLLARITIICTITYQLASQFPKLLKTWRPQRCRHFRIIICYEKITVGVDRVRRNN